MSADLHIHIYEGIEEADMVNFFSNTLGSKYFNPQPAGHISKYTDPTSSWYKVSNTSNIWIGEVSWLKAGLFEDSETFVPNTVAAIWEAVGEDLPEIDNAFIEKICVAFELENTTEYKLTTAAKVLVFLEEHRGKKVYTISW